MWAYALFRHDCPQQHDDRKWLSGGTLTFNLFYCRCHETHLSHCDVRSIWPCCCAGGCCATWRDGLERSRSPERQTVGADQAVGGLFTVGPHTHGTRRRFDLLKLPTASFAEELVAAPTTCSLPNVGVFCSAHHEAFVQSLVSCKRTCM